MAKFLDPAASPDVRSPNILLELTPDDIQALAFVVSEKRAAVKTDRAREFWAQLDRAITDAIVFQVDARFAAFASEAEREGTATCDICGKSDDHQHPEEFDPAIPREYDGRDGSLGISQAEEDDLIAEHDAWIRA
jgi:hypothetical protein